MKNKIIAIIPSTIILAMFTNWTVDLCMEIVKMQFTLNGPRDIAILLALLVAFTAGLLLTFVMPYKIYIFVNDYLDQKQS